MTLAATTVWEIRTDGSATNGGGYKSNAGTTDYSQQAAPVLSLSGATADVACTTGGAVITSATGGFTAAMVGNICYLSGTHFTTGWYEIVTYTNPGQVTLDRDPTDGSNGSSGTLNVGGALNSIGTLGAVFQVATQAVAGMKAYLRGGTYNLTETTVNVSGGPLDLDASGMDSKSFMLKGYATDAANRNALTGARPIIDCNGNTPANSNVIELKGSYSNAHVVMFIEIDGDSLDIYGIYGTSGTSGDSAISCIVKHCDGTAAFYGTNVALCYAYHCAANGFQGCYYGLYCIARECDTGFILIRSASHCIASKCATGYTFYDGRADCCVSYDCTSNGFLVQYTGILLNCVSYSDATYSAYVENTNTAVILFNFASDGAGLGRVRYAQHVDYDPIVLTANPFVDPDNNNFSLNDAEGGGALLKSAGIDPYGQIGNVDVGAVQHLDPINTVKLLGFKI